MGRWKWFVGRSTTCSQDKVDHVLHVPRQRDTLSDYCIGRPSPPVPLDTLDTLDHLVDFAIRNEPSERDRDELERHVDTFSDELELVEPTSLVGQFVRSLRNGGVLHPQSCWHLAWLLLVSACFVYNCVAIPLRSTFPYQTPDNWLKWFLCDMACDFVYLLDLVIVKPHVIFVYDGFWVREKKLTRKHYFAKWQFKMDILSLMPLDALYIKYGTEQVLVRLPRLLKIQTFWELFDYLDSLLMSPYLVRVARTLCYMMYLVHLNACGYYAFSAREGLGANSWTYKGGDGNAYIRCFYFATKTATSVGKNPRPETEGEYLFMTCSWLMGVFVFALLIGQIRDIVATASRTRTEHRKRLDETLEHMRGLSLPDHVQKRVQSWFTFADQHQPFDEGRILNSLPQKLKTDVAIDVHGTTLAKVQLFQKIADQALIRDLVLKLRSCIYLPGDLVCRKNEVGKEMYIVKTGQVEVLAPTNGEVLATLGEGCVFGEISLLALGGGNRRTADVRSKGFSNLFVLSKNDLHETLVYYPDAQKILKQKAEALMKENADRELREARMARGSPVSSQDMLVTGSDDSEEDTLSEASEATEASAASETSCSDSSPRSRRGLRQSVERHPIVRIRVTSEVTPPISEAQQAQAAQACASPVVPACPPPSPTETAIGILEAPEDTLPRVQVTHASEHDSDLTSVTCTTFTSKSSADPCGSSTTCTCSCTCSCSNVTVDTGVAMRPDDADDDDDDTLSDLSSASMLSPQESPTLERRRKRRVSAPTPTGAPIAEIAGLLAPHRLSFPSSRRKRHAMAQRTRSHQ